jgi:ribosomal protein S18 acetylase RimI-like enzyme
LAGGRINDFYRQVESLFPGRDSSGVSGRVAWLSRRRPPAIPERAARPQNRWWPLGSGGIVLDVIELRVLTPDDWPAWRELRLAALAEAPYAFGSRLADWQGEGDRGERWRARLDIPGSHNLLAVIEGRPVGMASGVPTDDRGVVQLISMWVHPLARGRGVGDQLVGAVERWARHVRADVLRLAVAKGNEAAAALYRRNGFHPTGVPGDPMLDGMRREQIMAKTLR